MQDYITAILETSTPEETYHGVAFSRKLEIRTLQSKSLTVQDTEGITNDLRPGKTYNFVLLVTGIDRVRAFTHSKTETARISGTIRALGWQPEEAQYAAFNRALTEQPLSIVGTAYGHLLLPRMLLGGVAVGNAVTWGKENYTLVAVYK